MTINPSIPPRVARCQAALDGYAGDNPFTNLVDLMADAMHWCHLQGRSLTHFEAERTDADILDDFNRNPINERNHL